MDSRRTNRAICRWILLAIAPFPGCGGRQHPKEKLPIVHVSKAEQESISEIVFGEAELFAYRQASLSPKIASPISRYLVNRGERVRKGQLLAVLENRDLSAAVKESQGAYDQAQANYATTTSASIPQELQKAELDVQDAKSNLDALQKVYDSNLVLYQQGALAAKAVDQSAVSLTAAKSQYLSALKHSQDLRSTVARQSYKSAAGQLEVAGANKLAAEVQLQYSELRSPIDGVVAYRNLYPGDIAPAGTILITVMDVSRVIAKLHIPQPKAALLKIGDSATLRVDGINRNFPGKVTVLSPALDPNSTTSEVWVEAPNPTPELQPGSSAQVSIVAKTVANAIVIPASSVITANDGTEAVMTVPADNSAHQQKVQLGIRNGDKVQIASGLSPGQVVISTGAYGLPDGTKVQPSFNPENQSVADTTRP